ncbi:iron ABC transporter permease [Thermoactinomyces sp. AMNI-1]|uniref:Iron ABC transporter permease n=2 Tax=Thermoactinomyces mirandus TaxID=2756294 RepID=A0A7W2ARK2_9BACL|nr:iron ABC transporter permease [Thermoactinomyces mirandus]
MSKHKKSLSMFFKFMVGLFVFIACFAAAMVWGAADTSIREVWLALLSGEKTDTLTMIREIRLPREVAAIFVGAALSVAGAIMQGLTRNPLADPGLLGLTAGANAALAIMLALSPSAGYLATTIACFVGAAVGMMLVFGIGVMIKGGFSSLRIVLAGAAVSAFLYGVAEGTGLYFIISKDISMWTAGGLIGTSWSQLQVAIPFIVLGMAVSFYLSSQLTILSLNEEVAVGLGQKINRVKTVLFIVIVLLAGSSVALVGNMAFVGLMVPHIVRTFTGMDYRFVLPMSAIIGASFMLLADTLGRTVNAPYETPVYAIVSVLGLPLFLFIIHKGGKTLT